jgi:hypothetical protein
MGGSQAAPDPNAGGVGTGWVGEAAACFELHMRVSTGLYGGVLDRGWTERNYQTRLYPDPPAARWCPAFEPEGAVSGVLMLRSPRPESTGSTTQSEIEIGTTKR